jgi:hypothetical protein
VTGQERLDDPHTTGGKHLIERAGELAVAVPDKKSEGAGAFTL